MSELTDLLLASSDPVTALALVGLGALDVVMFRFMADRFDRVASRIERLENVYIRPDGGREDGPD